MNLDYPLHFDERGRTAGAPDDAYVRDLIEQVLFTAPGERVNRPDFGAGALRLVFEPNSDVLAGTTRVLVQGALEQWLGDLISVQTVNVENREASLTVTVGYSLRRTGESGQAVFERPAGGP